MLQILRHILGGKILFLILLYKTKTKQVISLLKIKNQKLFFQKPDQF